MKMRSRPRLHQRAFTLVELLIAIAVVGVLLTLAAPSFFDFILVQRLKGTHAQLVTDLQFARSEAASRNVNAYVHFKTLADDPSMSCYTIYAISNGNWSLKCDCSQPPGSTCTDPATSEIRTVQIPKSSGISLILPDGEPAHFGFIPATGALRTETSDVAVRMNEFTVSTKIDPERVIRSTVGRSGRPTSCVPAQLIPGFKAC